MIDYYCWCQDISKEEYLKILGKSTVCREKDCRYDAKNQELCIQINQNRLRNNHVDDIFKDLECIIERKLECHINVQDDIQKIKLSVIQKNGIRLMKK